MSQQWFYGRDGHKLGPCTAQQLRDLALVGKIVVTDTIWKDGIDQGMSASRVKNLFPVPALLAPASDVLASDLAARESQPAPQAARSTEEPAAPGAPGATAEQVEIPFAAEESSPQQDPPARPTPEKKPARKGHALAIKGAKITGQDGISVQFRKICTTCGHEDPCRVSMPIRTGVTRMAFYCRKCRKSREVEIQGHS